VTSGWLDPTTDATYGHLARNYLFTGRETWAGGLALGIDSSWFWKPADWAAVALETGFLLAAIRRQWLCLWMALATLFHIGVLVLFAIPFSANVMAYGAFVGYTALPGFRSVHSPTARSASAWWIALAAASALGSLATLRGANEPRTHCTCPGLPGRLGWGRGRRVVPGLDPREEPGVP
jgi:hypothetical protein